MKKAKVLVKLLTFLVLSICVIILNFSTINAQKVISQDEFNCGAEKEGLKLCSETAQIEAKVNRIVIIQLLPLNLSEEKLPTGTPPIYEYKAVNESGESLETVFDKEAKEMGYLPDGQDKKGWRRKLRGGSSSLAFINPQEVQKGKINLSEVYNFTAPGKYIVSIKRRLPKIDGNGFVELVIEKIEIEVEDEFN